MKNTTLAIAVVAGLVISTFAATSTFAMASPGYGYSYGNWGWYERTPIPTPRDPKTPETPETPGDQTGSTIDRLVKRVLQIPWSSSSSTSTENNNQDIVMPNVLPQTGAELVYRVIKLINAPHTPSVK